MKFTYLLTQQIWGLFFILNGRFVKISVQTFQFLIVIYKRGNFVNHYVGCTSIYRPLSYPFRSLWVYTLQSSRIKDYVYKNFIQQTLNLFKKPLEIKNLHSLLALLVNEKYVGCRTLKTFIITKCSCTYQQCPNFSTNS